MTSQVEILQSFVTKVKEMERRFEEGQDDYAMEFLKIRLTSDELRDLDEFKSVVGTRAENFRKNRYRDILPFDYSRVTIDSKPSRNDSGDYINASFINGANNKVAYIATQGPLKETLADFWQMVYQYEATIIIMLCDLFESGKPKCEQYWPDNGSKLKFGELRITFVSEVKENEHYVLRTLRMKRKGSKEKERTIFQFQYFGWPDHGTPDEIAPLLEFIERIHVYQPDDKLSPLVVHCSAGCGRTGTVCALDYVRSLIKSKRVPSDFSVSNLVSDLRKQRPAMVQSKEQYILLHRAIALMFEHELNIVRSNHLQINVSDIFVSSPPLTPAPPVPAENSISPKPKSASASLSPTPSSDTSGTSASEENSSIQNSVSDGQKAPYMINGGSTAVVGSLIEVCDNTSITSYETVSTAKTNSPVPTDDEKAFQNERASSHVTDARTDVSNGTSNDILSAPNHSSTQNPMVVNNTHSNDPTLNANASSTYSSRDSLRTGTTDTIPGFPDKLSSRLSGPRPPPLSWPEHEEVLNHIQRL